MLVSWYADPQIDVQGIHSTKELNLMDRLGFDRMYLCFAARSYGQFVARSFLLPVHRPEMLSFGGVAQSGVAVDYAMWSKYLYGKGHQRLANKSFSDVTGGRDYSGRFYAMQNIPDRKRVFKVHPTTIREFRYFEDTRVHVSFDTMLRQMTYNHLFSKYLEDAKDSGDCLVPWLRYLSYFYYQTVAKPVNTSGMDSAFAGAYRLSAMSRYMSFDFDDMSERLKAYRDYDSDVFLDAGFLRDMSNEIACYPVDWYEAYRKVDPSYEYIASRLCPCGSGRPVANCHPLPEKIVQPAFLEAQML